MPKRFKQEPNPTQAHALNHLWRFCQHLIPCVLVSSWHLQPANALQVKHGSTWELRIIPQPQIFQDLLDDCAARLAATNLVRLQGVYGWVSFLPLAFACLSLGIRILSAAEFGLLLMISTENFLLATLHSMAHRPKFQAIQLVKSSRALLGEFQFEGPSSRFWFFTTLHVKDTDQAFQPEHMGCRLSRALPIHRGLLTKTMLGLTKRAGVTKMLGRSWPILATSI